MTALTDASNNRTQFFYDGEGRMIRQERPSVMTDSSGNTVATTEVTAYFYNGSRLVRKEVYPAGGTTKKVSVYTPHPKGDVYSQVTMFVENNGVPDESTRTTNTYTYASQTDATLLLRATNEHVILDFDYERVPPFAMTSFAVAATNPANPLELLQGSYTITRDITGEIASVQRPDGNTVFSAQYDEAGRMTHIQSGDNRLAVNIGFDSFGRKASVNHSTGLNGAYSYDDLNRVTSISWNGHDGVENQSIAEVIQYNAQTGNIDQISREFGTFTYQHDAIDQLTASHYAGTATLPSDIINRSWSYDRTGNRANDSLHGAGTIFANVLLENSSFIFKPTTDGTGSVAAKVHKDTNVIDLMRYRADGRLTRFENNKLSADYIYDPLGRRIAKNIAPKNGDPAFTQSYLHLGNFDQILMAKAGNGEVSTYLDGQLVDEHLGSVSSARVDSYATDHLGSVLNSSATRATRTLAAFGETLSIAPDITSDAEPVQYSFTGREYDSESRQYYYRLRNYDQNAGRFATPDPIGFSGGSTNFFEYVQNQSTLFVDPFGLKLQKIWLVGKGATYLDDSFAPNVIAFIMLASAKGVDFDVVSAFRTTEQQKALRKDRNATSPAKANSSLHEAGFAIDINFRDFSKADQEKILQAAREAGLQWGGNFNDNIHFYKEVPGGRDHRVTFIKRAQADFKSGVCP